MDKHRPLTEKRGGPIVFAGTTEAAQNVDERNTSIYHPPTKDKFEAHGSHMGQLAHSGSPAPVKCLLAHEGSVWMFQVQEAGQIYYTVELGDRVWSYNSLSWAQKKFTSEIRRGITQGRAQ
jgi:hypothetical protein